MFLKSIWMLFRVLFYMIFTWFSHSRKFDTRERWSVKLLRVGETFASVQQENATTQEKSREKTTNTRESSAYAQKFHTLTYARE